MSSQLARTSQTQTDSDEEDQHPRAPGDAGAEIARLKRRLAASPRGTQGTFARENQKATVCWPFNLFCLFLYHCINECICRTIVTMGRAIRRLVTLYESLDDLLQAADDHAINEDEDDEEEELTEEAQERRQE